MATRDPPDLASFLWGLLIGSILIGPFIWTELGREFVKEAVARGAGVAREKVEEWIRKGGG